MSDERTSSHDTPVDAGTALVPAGHARPLVYHEDDGYVEAEIADASRFDLKIYWRKIRKHARLIVVLGLLGATLAAFFMYRIRSRYEATAVVEINREQDIATTTDEFLAKGDTPTAVAPSGLNSRVVELVSEPTLEALVLELGLDRNPRFLAVNSPNSYTEMADAILGAASSSAAAGTVAGGGVPTRVERDRELQLTAEEKDRLRPYVATLRNNVSITPNKESSSVRITFSHTDPGIAAAVANGLAETLVERNFENRTAKYANILNWLERATHELKARAENAEQALARYSEENEIFGTTSLPGDNLVRISQQAAQAETTRILKESLYNEVKAGRLDQLPETFVDQRLIELNQRLADLKIQAAQLDVKYGAENPKVIDIQHHIAGLEQQLAASRRALEDRLRADYELAARDEQSLKAAVERAKAETAEQNKTSTNFNILKQEVETASGMYRGFLEKVSEARVRLAEQHNNMRVVAPAQEPGAPVSPQRLAVILAVLAFSLAVGIGLAFVMEALDTSVRTVDDVDRFLGLPTLGVIPAFVDRANGSGGVLARALPRNRSSEAEGDGARLLPAYAPALDNFSPASEAYRSLRTSVLLTASETPPKTLLITSGQPGEGKTTTALNTAISLAQLGRTVLVIDADLRKPMIHKSFGVNRKNGLSTYLTSGADYHELIRGARIKNLFLLPAGPVPPNPSELVSSERMETLLASVSAEYDFIVIDSPPLACATDSVVMSVLVDGVILVVQSGKSPRQIVQHARKELASVGARLFGVVLNSVDFKHEGAADYYYMRYASEYYHRGGEAAKVQ
jgi:capsular exopolysaccharide synthesis family protein